MRYLDVAANHARKWSNTYFFDRCQGWKGVCVEPNPKYWNELKTERTCRVVEKCLSDRPSTVQFAFANAYGGVLSSDGGEKGLGVSEKFMAKHQVDYTGTKEIRCSTLKHELAGGQHFDLMSLDVEHFELPVLKGLNWEQTIIDVIVVENRDREVRDLLASKGYDRYSVIKDDIYIRRGSSYGVDSKYVGWYKAIERKTGAVKLGLET
jgi:FkbM family methyltransferase